MSIKTMLTADMKEAMRARDKFTLTTIRSMIDRIQKKEKELLRDLTEEEAVTVIQSVKKQSEESLEGFKTRGDADKIEALEEEIKIIFAYLPKQLNKEEVRAIVDRLAAGLDNKGAVMKAVMSELKGKTDNKLISEVVDEFLAN